MMINIVTAFTAKGLGIGVKGSLPWNIPEDMKRFVDLTRDKTVIMGRKTWESIGCKALKNRKNIVVTKNPEMYCYEGVSFVDAHSLKDMLEDDVFVIGGTEIYRMFMGKADTIYATIVYKEFQCDATFPLDNFDQYMISEYSDLMYSEKEGCNIRYITYKKSNKIHEENVYLNLATEIMNEGEDKPDRTGVGTKSVFAKQVTFNISSSFPLLTTKFVPFQTILKELLWFLKGSTDSKQLEKDGVNIWRGNTSRDFLNKRGLSHYNEGDLGPMYFWIVKHIGATYEGCEKDYRGKGIDQLEHLIENLKSNPHDRRHLLTTYCPLYNEQGCLYPCHGIVIQFWVGMNNTLSCHMYQRSVDVAVGFPFNIASYAILTQIIAKKCGMKPSKLIISTGDTHVYNNLIDAMNTQLIRTPLPFPILEVDDSVIDTMFEDLEPTQFRLIGYLHHPRITMPMAL